MAKIIAPNGQYAGVSASVSFSGGVGHTDNPHLIAWFYSHGYTVEEEAVKPPKEKPVEKMTVEELKAYAQAHGITLPDGKKEELLAAILAAGEP